jgi:hypothetical protein
MDEPDFVMPDIDGAIELQSFLYSGLKRTFIEHDIKPSLAAVMLVEMVGEIILEIASEADDPDTCKQQLAQMVVDVMLEQINGDEAQGHLSGTA